MTVAASGNCEGCSTATRVGLADWHRCCPGCGLETAALDGFIDDRAGPDIDEDQRERALRPIRDANFNALLAWLRSRVAAAGDRKPALLDVGCAHGWFLEKAAPHFEVLGIEPDQEVASRTMSRGLPVRRGYFPEALQDNETFDIIVFNDVLEHIPDVRSALKECTGRLRDGGVIVVNAPDAGGAIYRISKVLARVGLPGPFDRMWQKGLPSPHLYYFSTSSIAAVADQAGLQVTGRRRLPSVVAQGLFSRIRCSGDISVTKAALVALGALALVPILRLLPSDIMVWTLARKS